LDRAKQRFLDPDVEVDQVALRLLRVREVDLVGVRDADVAPLDVEGDLVAHLTRVDG
jgi:hypothetical protein